MKERLTGAIILVALIVLLVPELLTGPVRSAPRTASATAVEGAPLRSYTIQLTDEPRARDSDAPASGPQQPAPVAAPPAPASSAVSSPDPPATAAAPTETALPPAQTPAPPPAARPAASHPQKTPSTAAAHATSAAPASSGELWVVQLGSFASRSNAERLAQQVRAGGFTASVSQAATGRKLYRVRVGPVHDHAAATELAGRLRAAGHGGSVVPK